jgi:hypothetical protein
MAGVTDNYQFVTDVAVDDFVQPEHNNRIADTVDRVLGSVLRRLLSAGAYEGWTIETDATVVAGQGLVADCWCETTQAQAVTGLTSDAVNHVFLEATADGPPDGTVNVFAQLSADGPADAIYLGTIELDAACEVVAIDNSADGVERACYPIAWSSLAGEGTIAAVPAGGEASEYVTHESLRLPGAIELSSDSADFTWEISETWRADQFLLTVTNNGASEADFEYEWTREGIAEQP